MRLIWWAIIMVGFAVVLSAQSPVGGEKPNEKTATQEIKAGDHNTSTEKATSTGGVPQPPNQNAEPKKDGSDRQETILESLFTTVDGLTFWVLVIQSAFLWWTITVMWQSDEKQLRPYVSINLIHPPWPTATGIISFEFKCINHGQSPAKDIAFRADAWCMDVPITAGGIPLLAGPWNEGRMNIFPNEDPEMAKKWRIPCTLGKRMTQDETNSIVRQHQTLVLAVEVRYADMFNKQHITKEYYAIGAGGSINLIPQSSVLT